LLYLQEKGVVPYIKCCLLTGMSAMEGRGTEGSIQEVKDKFLTLYMVRLDHAHILCTKYNFSLVMD